MRTLVVFHDHGAFWFSKYLRWGFRHVFICVLDDAGYWIRLDGMKGLPSIEVAAGEKFDLASYYRRENGFTVLIIDADRAPRPPFLMAGTCVGLVKAMLGIRAAWVLTPYQLYRYLKRRTHHG